MADDDASSATNARVISKLAAVGVCAAAMSEIANVYCSGVEQQFVITPDFTEQHAAVAAAALGATVRFITSPVVNNVGRRVAVMRLSVGLITSTMTAESLAASYPQEMVQMDGAADEAALSAVSLPLLKALPADAQQVVQLAKQINSTAPVVGDSVLEQAPTKVAANFNVIFSVINIIQILQSEEAVRTKQENLGRSECSEIMREAFDKAQGKSANIFHQKSYKTETGVKRYHGKKKSRRN